MEGGVTGGNSVRRTGARRHQKTTKPPLVPVIHPHGLTRPCTRPTTRKTATCGHNLLRISRLRTNHPSAQEEEQASRMNLLRPTQALARIRLRRGLIHRRTAQIRLRTVRAGISFLLREIRLQRNLKLHSNRSSITTERARRREIRATGIAFLQQEQTARALPMGRNLR